jgi:catechol 2,3-dioxygenase-like lactoylglutathione lyase family enzyme
MDYRLEVVQVPVSDVDRSKAFYAEQMGFNADHDTHISDEVRVVQLTPPGSACSIVIGTGLTDKPPGSAAGLQLVVGDMDTAVADFAGRGLDVGDVQMLGAPGRQGFKHIFFSDLDGNRWTVQEIRR